MGDEVPVLVVGGSLVGLSAAMFLRSRGVPVALVEPHLGSSPHPRAIGYTARTLELFASVGLDVPQAPPGFRLKRRKVHSLAGEWTTESEWTPERVGPPVAKAPASPMTGAAIAQDALEPMLRQRARELDADLRLGFELVRFEQDAGGVTAWVRERATGNESTIRAQYLVACDGGPSPVREALGIKRSGRGHLKTMRSVLFRAPLEQYLESGVHQFEIEQPGFQAFLTTYNDGRWVLMFGDDVERSRDELLTAVQKAIGRDDLPIEIITTGRWELTALIADSFSKGRVFLAGDSAHQLPPTRGGYGANTGLHDAHNLAWKLAAVLSGESSPKLLDTYEAERRPAAWNRMLQTFARPDYAREANGIADGVPIADEVAMELGQLYRSSAILGAGPELPHAATPLEWKGQPGTRAPHVWLERDGKRVSSLELFGKDWVTVTFESAPEPLRQALGLAPGEASLVRPDGYIAFRGPLAQVADARATVSHAAASRAYAQRA